MKFQTFFPLAVIGAALGTASVANAAITVLDSGGFASATAGTLITVTSANLGGFDGNGSDKVVVTITGERSGTSNNTVASVTYGGVQMTLAVAKNDAIRKASIWYLDNVSVTGDFVVDFVATQSGIGFSALALDGTLPDFADTGISSVTTTTSGEIVVGAAYQNGGAVTAGSPFTQTFTSTATGSSSGAAGYWIVGSPQTVDLAASFTGEEAVIGAAFQAIPEPSAALLGGVGMLMLLRRRRN